MEEQKKRNPLETEKEGKLIAKFAIPAIISMLVSSLYNIVDQIFIGQGVGLLGNAATNIAFPVSIICTATALLLGIGSASNFNLCSGAGDHEKASRIAGTGLAMLVICGVIIAAVTLVFLNPLLHIFGVTAKILPYAQDYTGITAFGIPFLILTTGGNHLIRADRSPTYSMTCMLTGAIINTILDPLFIFGFHWGIKGAAWATVIGQIVSGIMVIVYFGQFRKMELKKEMFRPSGKMVFMAIAIGISQGCQPIWGFNYGAEAYDRVKRTYWKAFQIAMAVGIVFFLCFQFFPTQLVSIFGTGSKEYYQFAARYFRIFMFMTFINGIQPMSSGFFTSIGKAKLGIVVSLTRQVIFLLPLILIFPLYMGIDGVMYAGPIADAAAGIVAIGFALKELRAMDEIA